MHLAKNRVAAWPDRLYVGLKLVDGPHRVVRPSNRQRRCAATQLPRLVLAAEVAGEAGMQFVTCLVQSLDDDVLVVPFIFVGDGVEGGDG